MSKSKQQRIKEREIGWRLSERYAEGSGAQFQAVSALEWIKTMIYVDLFLNGAQAQWPTGGEVRP